MTKIPSVILEQPPADSSQRCPFNHGQFYRAADLVAAVHADAGGMFAGFRAAHAFGRIYYGAFIPTATAKTMSRAAHFQGAPTPATARLSAVSGDPKQNPSKIVAMATKFFLPDGTVTDLIGITLPAFFARTPEEFIAVSDALALDPLSGQPDLSKLGPVLASYPNAASLFRWLQDQPDIQSLASATYRPLHAYLFTNAQGVSRWARYVWKPEAPGADPAPKAPGDAAHDHLFEEFEGRLAVQPVRFRLELQLARDGDPVGDPSSAWPEDREHVIVGHLELLRRITEGEIGDPVMMHDPTAVTDGIEISPDDQLIAARRGAYLLSVAERSGGWRSRASFGAR